MSTELAFDRYGSINESRGSFLRQLLLELREPCDLRSALDAGCGVGHFSEILVGMGLSVTAFDGRPENIEVARTRYPNVKFQVYNVEESRVLDLESSDLVLCFGLLYHLENPFLGVRHLNALTKKVMIVESMIFPHPLPVASIVDEKHQEDQGLNYVAFVPSEAGLVKMLYASGFRSVYRPHSMPEHPDFRGSMVSKQRRTILVASNIDLPPVTLERLAEPHAVKTWRIKWVDRARQIQGVLPRPLKSRS